VGVGGAELFGGSPVLLAAGKGHRAALTEDGAIWTSGAGNYGQLGLVLLPTRLGPEAFGGSPVVLVRMAACGLCHTLVLTEDGVVWTFGEGEFGRLGLDDEDGRLVPTRVDPQRLAGAQVSTVAAGLGHSAAVTEGGALFTWGRGEAFRTACRPGPRRPARQARSHARVFAPARRRPRRAVAPLCGGAHAGLCLGHARPAGVGGAGGGGRRRSRLVQGLALAEGEDRTHRRCPYLMMLADLVQRAVEACSWGGGGQARKLGEGVLRLMGTGRREAGRVTRSKRGGGG